MIRRGLQAILTVGLVVAAGCGADQPVCGRVVTFGDSNTDRGFNDSVDVVAGYLTPVPTALRPDQGNSRFQLAGKIELLEPRIRAVNHGIGATTSGFGRVPATSSPNARESVNGVTRFEAEVLGRGYPWSGGETRPIIRVLAFQPTASDYAYVSIGTNDHDAVMTAADTRCMIATWMGAGLRADHLLLTTLPPNVRTTEIPATNDSIRAIANQTGVHLIDLGGYTSNDGGATWREVTLHVGDSIHYRERVRDWLAAQVVASMKVARCTRDSFSVNVP